MKSSSRFGLRVIICLLFAVLGAGAAVLLRQQKLPFASASVTSMAKLLVVKPANNLQPDYYLTIAGELESETLAQKAAEKLQKQEPELKASKVQIRVDQPPRETMTLIATGEDARYTPKLLNAVLDEFLASRISSPDKAASARPEEVEKQLAEQERAAQSKLEALTEAKKLAGGAVLKAEQERQTARATELKSQQEELTTQINLLGAGTPERGLLEKKSEQLASDLKGAQTAIQEAEALEKKIATLEEEYQKARQGHDTLTEKLQQSQQETTKLEKEFTVHYRATEPVEAGKIHWRDAFQSHGLLGGGAGLLLGILIAMLIGPGGNQYDRRFR